MDSKMPSMKQKTGMLNRIWRLTKDPIVVDDRKLPVRIVVETIHELSRKFKAA